MSSSSCSGRPYWSASDLRDIEVDLSHAGLVRAVLAETGLAPEEQASRYDRLLDGDLSVIQEIEARLPELRAPLHLLFETEGGAGTYLDSLRSAFAGAVPGMAEALDELATVSETLDRLDCPHGIQTTLVRNFEYYTGPVFEFRAAGCRLGSGGRYDGLVALVGGESAPASGFALSLAELVSHLDVDVGDRKRRSGNGSSRPAATTRATLAEAFAAAQRLRALGHRATIGLTGLIAAPGDRLLTIERREGAFTYKLREIGTESARDFGTLEEVLRDAEADRS